MKTFRFFTMLTLTMLIGAATAMAQTPEKITVHAPFEFTVADKTLPAGDYTIRPLLSNRLLIRSDDGREALIATTFNVRAKETPSPASLVFARYGERYFLSQILVPSMGFGRELMRSRVEVRLAKTASPSRVPVPGR
jgi:hypothetical protein